MLACVQASHALARAIGGLPVALIATSTNTGAWWKSFWKNLGTLSGDPVFLWTLMCTTLMATLVTIAIATFFYWIASYITQLRQRRRDARTLDSFLARMSYEEDLAKQRKHWERRTKDFFSALEGTNDRPAA